MNVHRLSNMATKTKSTIPYCEMLLIILTSLIVRWCISLAEYSGANKPHLFGDFEAQRHWMEITYHLPITEWYHNTTDNDLLYWGLDYPPLTAYHSWLLGAVSHRINPSWVALHSSRGIEVSEHKLFMRYTVVLADLFIFIPALCLYIYTSSKCENSKKLLTCLSILLYPGLMLIDHGHFQYNCVSLGLALWAILALFSGHDLLGSIAFTLSLCYKQMELYHAWPFFCYLLGKCYYSKKNRLFKLISIAVSVIATFAVCFFPFLQRKEDIFQIFRRLFPFARGLYEDKVANIWCSLSVIIKLKEIFSLQSVLLLCLVCTSISLLPSGFNLIQNPTFLKFKFALVNSSLVFFLLSFQVHEKSILLAALPVCLLLPDYPFVSFWFLQISTFSMFPLFVKDGLLVHYFSTLALFSIVVSVGFDLTPKQKVKKQWIACIYPFLPYMLFVSLVGCLLLNIASLLVAPPASKPHLFPLLISFYSCVHFVCFLIYFHYAQFTVDSQTGKISIGKSLQQSNQKVPNKMTHNLNPMTQKNNRKFKRQ